MVTKQPITKWIVGQRRNPERNKKFLDLNESENTTEYLGCSESGPKKVIYSSKYLH